MEVSASWYTRDVTFQRLIVLTAATLFITEGVVQAQAPDSASEASPEASSEEDAGAAVVADWIRLNETPERLSHQNRAELTVLSRDIQSSDPRRRRDALRRIARLYGDRREISPELTDLLVLVAVRPFVEVNMSAGSSVLSPDVRIQALQVLGEVGGTKSLSAIELVLRLEEDPAVVESALHSLQKMKAQPTEEITAGLTHLLSRRQLSLDEGVASAALETVRVLGRPPYAITDPDLFQAILGVAQGPYPRRIRQDAYDLVDELRKPR